MSTFAVGDWVHSYGKGIWQVSRVLTDFNEFRWSLDDPIVRSTRTLIFANRLVNASWKRSFGSEFCEQFWVRAISKRDRAKVDRLMLGADKLRLAFEKYVASPRPVGQIVNLRFRLPKKGDRERFQASLAARLDGPIQNGMILDEILQSVRDAGYEGCMHQNPGTATLQLLAHDDELRGLDFVLREYRVLPF